MRTVIRPRARDLIAQTWQSQANLAFFLFLLVITVFVLPCLPIRRERIALFSDVVYTFVLASGVAIGWGRKHLFTAGILVAIPAMMTRWGAWLLPGSRTLVIASEALAMVAVLVISYVVLAQVFREGPINMVRVQGAVAAYLMLGVAFACAYQLDWQFNPAAFQSSEGQLKLFVDWLYFSFCTLSTLGYGDIVPTTHVSRSLATAEVITGQLFLAITIARLVAMQASGRAERESTAHIR